MRVSFMPPTCSTQLTGRCALDESLVKHFNYLMIYPLHIFRKSNVLHRKPSSKAVRRGFVTDLRFHSCDKKGNTVAAAVIPL